MRSGSALIIDDDTDLCSMLSEVLKGRKIAVTVANTLFEAKLAIKQENPSIIILDNTLPDGNGIEFTGYLKIKCPDSKIIFITGDYEIGNEETAAKGISKIIRKPFTLDKLRAILDLIQ